MATLVDSSALVALLSERDQNHDAAERAFTELRATEQLLTHNYVVVETTAVVARRLGAHAVRDLHDSLLPAIDLVWVDEHLHALAVSALLAAGRISFVDWVSFEVMRRLDLDSAFSFDRDFARQGFEVVP